MRKKVKFNAKCFRTCNFNFRQSLCSVSGLHLPSLANRGCCLFSFLFFWSHVESNEHAEHAKYLYVQLLTSLKQCETFPKTQVKDNQGVYHEKNLLVQCKYVADGWLFFNTRCLCFKFNVKIFLSSKAWLSWADFRLKAVVKPWVFIVL